MNRLIQRFCSTSKGWKFKQLKDAKILSIENVQSEQKFQYPFVWLRDNCQCSQCFNRTSKSRIMDLRTNLKVHPVHIELKVLVRPIQKNDEEVFSESMQRADEKRSVERENAIDEIAKENHKMQLKKNTDETSSASVKTEIVNDLKETNKREGKENNETNESKLNVKASNENKLELGDKTNEITLHIEWEDKHESDFPINWLLERNFTADNRAKLDEIYKIRRIPWTTEEFVKVCSRFTFEDVMTDDRSLLKWLECLSTYGVAIVTRAGVEIGALKRLASRVGFLKRTQYGETFRVEAKPGTSNVAYLSTKLQLHTDLPYYEYKPGLNMLHCLVQADGALQGRNQLSDCLAVIEHLRTNRRRVFELLSTTLVDWTDYGQDAGYKFANIHRAPVICLDARGDVTRVNFSQPQRDSVFNVPIEAVEPWYDAMAEFTDLLHHPKYLVELKLRPGEVLTFDNIRLVHGREGYEGERLLEGGYLDWDLVRSRVKVLRSKLNSRSRS